MSIDDEAERERRAAMNGNWARERARAKAITRGGSPRVHRSTAFA